MDQILKHQSSRVSMGKNSVSLRSHCSTAQSFPLKPWLVLGTVRKLNMKDVRISLFLIFKMQIVQIYKSLGEMKALNSTAKSEKQLSVF